MTEKSISEKVVLQWLQQWYMSQTNGEWEHEFGVGISTLDNPGWRLKIDLKKTELEGTCLDRVIKERTENDWMHCWADGDRFEGTGGPENLLELLDNFRAFAEGGSARDKSGQADRG